MEINKTSDIIGVITTEEITEGRCVLLTSHPGYSSDLTGRLEDIPGVKLPDTEAEADEARYILTWPQDQREPPIVDWPSYNFALRQAFDKDANAPITGKTIYMTWPGMQESVAIPSGHLACAMGQGVYTIPSGEYIYSAAVKTPGQKLEVADTASDTEAESGQLQEHSSGTAVARVVRFESDTHDLTVRTFNP